MRECPSCGEDLEEGVSTCWNCGVDAAEENGGGSPDACSRCGRELAGDELGSLEDPKPLCEDCRREVEFSEDEERLCPVDQTQLEKEEYRTVILDRCPVCGGVWLDDGQLAAIEREVLDGD